MKNRDKIDASNIIGVQGGKHVTYDGLLDLAHREGLVSLTCRLVQAPDAGNAMTAICEAEAVFRKGEQVQTFGDIGDANSGNTNKMIGLHIIRMASTRAKARTLRDALNIDGCSAEELVDYAPDLHEDGAPTQARTKAAPKAEPSRQATRSGWAPTEAQQKRLFGIAKAHGLQASDVKSIMRDNGIGLDEKGEPHTNLIGNKAHYDRLADVLIPAAGQEVA